jgi:hypothetical protein
MLDRRALIGAAIALPFVSLKSALAATSLDQYVVLLGDGTGKAENTTNGFRLKGGLYNDTESGIRLFSKDFTLPSAGTLKFKLTRELIPPTVTSNGVWFNVGIVWGKDPTTLPPDEPTGDTYTSTVWDGWRITMANKAKESTVSNRLRLTTYMPRKQLTSREAKVTANFKLNVTSLVTLTWSGRVVTISTLGKKQSWADDQLRVPSSGGPRLMFYGSPGGQWRVEDDQLL